MSNAASFFCGPFVVELVLFGETERSAAEEQLRKG